MIENEICDWMDFRLLSSLFLNLSHMFDDAINWACIFNYCLSKYIDVFVLYAFRSWRAYLIYEIVENDSTQLRTYYDKMAYYKHLNFAPTTNFVVRMTNSGLKSIKIDIHKKHSFGSEHTKSYSYNKESITIKIQGIFLK